MTLKHKITFLISLMLIVMILISIKAIYNQSSTILNEEAQTIMISQLDRANENVTLLLKNIVLETEKLSQSQNVKDYFSKDFSQSESDDFLTDLMAKQNDERPVYMDLFLVDHEGIIVSAAMPEAVGIDVSGRQYFQRAFMNHETNTRDIILSRADNTQIVITLTPTYDYHGNVMGYTGIAIFATYFSNFLEAFEFHDDSEYIIVDSYDKIVSHPNRARISSKFDNFGLKSFDTNNSVSSVAEDFVTAEIEGEAYIVMERLLNFNEWRIVSYLKVDEIYSKSRELAYTFFKIGLVFIFIAIGMGIYITDIVSKPIVEITETINRIIEEEETYKTTMINKLPFERLEHNSRVAMAQEPEEISNFRKAIQGFRDVLEQGAKNFDVELNQLKTYIDNLYHELDNINSRNLDFISTLSHDIRTPLTLIKGYARGLESGEITNDEMKHKFKSGIVKSANDIEYLIYNVLDFAYEVGDSNTFNKKTYTLSEMVNQIAFETKQLYSEVDRNITFDIDDFSDGDDKKVHIDMMNMNRVIVNLINNSLKYSTTTDEVILRIKKMDHGAKIEVYDEGFGIKDEELNKITELFYRTEASKDKKGYGLGLYISDQILKGHGIELQIESEVDVFTTMGFEILYTS